MRAYLSEFLLAKNMPERRGWTKKCCLKKLSDERGLELRKNICPSAVIAMRKWHAQETVHASHFSVHHAVFC
jgi:hypothetical protein